MLILMFLVCSCHLASDSVQISQSLGGKFAASILILLHHFQPLCGLQHPPGHTLGAAAEVAGHDAIALAAPVDLGHGADASTVAEVQMLGCGSCSGIEPVLIVWGQLLVLAQLDRIHPLRHLRLS